MTRVYSPLSGALKLTASGVRRERRRFPVGVSPTRPSLQPEAAGAAKEVTNWLKPSESVSRIGDSASVQAVTRVNAEKASKRTMRRPTRSGKADGWVTSENHPLSEPTRQLVDRR